MYYELEFVKLFTNHNSLVFLVHNDILCVQAWRNTTLSEASNTLFSRWNLINLSKGLYDVVACNMTGLDVMTQEVIFNPIPCVSNLQANHMPINVLVVASYAN